MNRRNALAALAGALLAGCTLGPDFTRPEAPAGGYAHATPAPTATRSVDLGADVADGWYQLFHSAALDQPPQKVNNASALINLARNFGGSLGIAFAATLLTRRAQFHQSRIVEHLQALNPAYTDFTHQVGGALGAAPDASATLASIYQGAVQQATLLSYLDDFKVLGLIFLALLPLLLLVRGGKGGEGPVPAH